MKLSPQRRMPRRIALGVVLVVLSAFLATTAATASASSASPEAPSTSSELTAIAQVSMAPSRTASLAAAEDIGDITASITRRSAPTAASTRPSHVVTRAVARPAASRIRPRSASASRSATRSTSRKASTVTRTSSGGSLAQARSILAGYIARYPICQGASVYFGKTPSGSEGCIYLGSGTIVINPNHTSSLSYIIGHEIQHLRAYRGSH